MSSASHKVDVNEIAGTMIFLIEKIIYWREKKRNTKTRTESPPKTKK